jgi:flavin-dependent dehydrogenase
MKGSKDILVVGAGPAGLVAAINLKREGFNVILREKQARVGGEPGWHPSVHTTPVDDPGLYDYIGINCAEAFVNSNDVLKVYVAGKEVPGMRQVFGKLGMKNTERGDRPTSLDSFLFRVAEKEGVTFEFGRPFTEDDLAKAPSGTIIATGLTPGMYDWLGIDHTIFAGYWANTPAEPGFVSNTFYLGQFSNEYGYACAMNGIWYVLLFARREVEESVLESFRKVLAYGEGRTFDKWRRFQGHTPKGPRLFHKGFILAGTMAGVVEPAFGGGITGALLSGKIAAMAVTEPDRALAEFKRFTDGIVTHIARKKAKVGYAPTIQMGKVWFDVK